MASLARRSLLRVLMLGTLAVATPGCVMSSAMPEVIESPQIQARAVQFMGGNGGAIVMRVELVGYNPNTFALYATQLHAQLSIQGQSLGRADATFSQMMPARRPLVLLVDVALSGANIPAILAAVSARNYGQQSVGTVQIQTNMASAGMPFRVDGDVQFRSRFGEARAGFGFDGTVNPGTFGSTY
ncbi:MAG: LEA type 2 family protein [Deltaproteobacteria bacterium]|nr:LEA type 2 family protein [Deltaproteobacteria bacterium]